MGNEVAGLIIVSLGLFVFLAFALRPPRAEPEPEVFYLPEEPRLPEGWSIVYFGREPWFRIAEPGMFSPRYERAFKEQDDLFPRRPGKVYSYTFDAK